MASEDAQIPSEPTAVRRVGLLACYVLILAAILVFAGWQFRIPILRGQVFGSFVSPNAALCFILCGFSILLQTSGSQWREKIGAALGIAVGFFALLILIEHLTGFDFGIDRIVFAHRLDDWFLPTPGRFAITSAIAFVVGGVGLAFLRHKGRVPFADLSGGLVLGVSYMASSATCSASVVFMDVVNGYAHSRAVCCHGHGNSLYQRHGWVAGALASSRLGGLLVAGLTFAVIFLIPTLAAIETWLENRKIVNPEGGMAMLVLVVVAIFITLVLTTRP